MVQLTQNMQKISKKWKKRQKCIDITLRKWSWRPLWQVGKKSISRFHSQSGALLGWFCNFPYQVRCGGAMENCQTTQKVHLVGCDPKNQATSIPYNCIFETLNYHQLAETPNHRHIHTESTKKFIPQTATPAPAKKQRPLKSRWICWLYLRHWQCRQHFSSRKLCVQGLQAWHFYQKCIGNVCAVAAPPPLHQTVFFLPFFKGVLSKSSSRSG